MDPDGGFFHQHPLVYHVLPLACDDGWAFSASWLPPLPSSPAEGKASGCEAVHLGMCRALWSSSSLPLQNLWGDLGEHSSDAGPTHHGSPARLPPPCRSFLGAIVLCHRSLPAGGACLRQSGLWCGGSVQFLLCCHAGVPADPWKPIQRGCSEPGSSVSWTLVDILIMIF